MRAYVRTLGVVLVTTALAGCGEDEAEAKSNALRTENEQLREQIETLELERDGLAKEVEACSGFSDDEDAAGGGQAEEQTQASNRKSSRRRSSKSSSERSSKQSSSSSSKSGAPRFPGGG